MMRDFRRHPDSTAPDLGLQCLRAVTIDNRFDDRVRAQAEELLALATGQHKVEATGQHKVKPREPVLVLADA